MQKITTCLWFDDQAEEAANFYASIFRNSKIGSITRYGEAGKEIHGKPREFWNSARSGERNSRFARCLRQIGRLSACAGTKYKRALWTTRAERSQWPTLW